MDPNEALRQIRAAIDDWNEYEICDVESLITLVEGLDNWISGGGFLPNDWDRASVSTIEI